MWHNKFESENYLCKCKYFGIGEGSGRENKIVNVVGLAHYEKHEKQNNRFVSEKWRGPRIQTLVYHLAEQWKK